MDVSQNLVDLKNSVAADNGTVIRNFGCAWGEIFMKCGILGNVACRTVFEWINERPICPQCRTARKKFKDKDRKGKRGYSNLVPGFSSKKLDIPIDIMIVGQGHGGKQEKSFRKQRTLEEEIEWALEGYGRSGNHPMSFHAQEMKELFDALDTRKKTWVYTDLVKCYVWSGVDKKDNLKGSENFKKAIGYCRNYLQKQIQVLKPRTVLTLGGLVTRVLVPTFLEGKHKLNDFVYEGEIEGHKCRIVSSYFPSRYTADLWVKSRKWKPALAKLK